MNENDIIPSVTVRDDYVPKQAYTCPEFARREKQRLWPRVWQVACREEEIPRVGDYVTYEICDESFIVVRSGPETIRAFYNVCLHRGRRLTAGVGKAPSFYCNYHGWRWNLDGSIQSIVDRDDWAGCPSATDDDFSLKEVQVDTWGGFVYLNPDPNAESLAEYLSPMPDFIDPFELEKMRYRWYVSVKLPCNWKVALEAFNEGYHVQATHPQLMNNYGEDITRSFAHGKHGMFGYFVEGRPWGTPSPRTGKPMPEDIRPGVIRAFDEYNHTLKAIFTERDTNAARRLMTEMEPTQDGMAVTQKVLQLQKEAAEAEGAGWPAITLEELGKAGTDWHVFPNQIFLMYPDGALCYRSRPNGDDPDSCIYDVWSIQRYAPGAEPKLERQYFYGDDDWRGFHNVSIILQQDFDNMEEVQKGMKSVAFEAARPSPLQETSVSNMHKHLHEYLNNQ